MKHVLIRTVVNPEFCPIDFIESALVYGINTWLLLQEKRNKPSQDITLKLLELSLVIFNEKSLSFLIYLNILK